MSTRKEDRVEAFQSTPSGGKATSIAATAATTVRQFQSTPSGGKATTKISRGNCSLLVSIHAFRGEGDSCTGRCTGDSACFNPRLPGGRRLDSSHVDALLTGFNPRLPGGRRRSHHQLKRIVVQVSIHAFRGEGDAPGARLRPGAAVSIHAFRGEGDVLLKREGAQCIAFQSTPSGGKATSANRAEMSISGGFNPRLPGGRRLDSPHVDALLTSFNPRLPGGRRPDLYLVSGLHDCTFQSTPSGGKATTSVRIVTDFVVVSIHAFRGEGDLLSVPHISSQYRFNPRLPGGRRLAAARLYLAQFEVSIHAFRGEGDVFRRAPLQTPSGRFNPRLPGGRRRRCRRSIRRRRVFQSTPSGGKATSCC